ncbi:MAG: ferrous iron transport protein A [Planctomycetaceae bacterium]|nr:ferrous iron transport protein A [Planctomycetaceae bacterium]
MHDLVPLNLLGAGQSGYVRQILGDEAQVHRLHEMGLHGGQLVEMVQRGVPCIIRLDGSKICFRADEGTNVLVQPAHS